MRVWCVKHKKGWCAVEGNKVPPEGENNVKTRCGHNIVLPLGFEERQPDCEDCLDIFRKRIGTAILGHYKCPKCGTFTVVHADHETRNKICSCGKKVKFIKHEPLLPPRKKP